MKADPRRGGFLIGAILVALLAGSALAITPVPAIDTSNPLQNTTIVSDLLDGDNEEEEPLDSAPEPRRKPFKADQELYSGFGTSAETPPPTIKCNGCVPPDEKSIEELRAAFHAYQDAYERTGHGSQGTPAPVDHGHESPEVKPLFTPGFPAWGLLAVGLVGALMFGRREP